MKIILLTALALAFNVSAISQVKDVDGNEYKTVQIGEQEWMAEDLNVTHFRNGDKIPHAATAEEWTLADKKGEPAWCYIDNDSANTNNCGVLYNWFAVNDSRGLAPEGWLIPDNKSWEILKNHLGQDAGKNLKSISNWPNDGNGTNESRFTGFPCGGRLYSGEFTSKGVGYWWSSSVAENNEFHAGSWFLQDNSDELFNSTSGKGIGMSVRCIKK